MLSCITFKPILTFDYCTSSKIGWHFIEFKIIFYRNVVNFVKIGCKIFIHRYVLVYRTSIYRNRLTKHFSA